MFDGKRKNDLLKPNGKMQDESRKTVIHTQNLGSILAAIHWKFYTMYQNFFSILGTLTFLLTFNFASAQTKSLNLEWKLRNDVNILLPSSIRIYETNGHLPDSSPIRAMCTIIDLRDNNLKLHAVGSNDIRETTLDTYQRYNAIFAINGGYFSATKSESILVSDGELIASGPSNFTRGAFGIINHKPQIVWPYAIDSSSSIFHLSYPVATQKNPAILHSKKSMAWHPSQAVGGGPVLIKNGNIHDTSEQEGFGDSHLLRHPRTAIGYRDEHTLVMVVVDGRQKASAGVTIKELAQLMHELGCYEAVNLDGGGSSTMVAADEVVNVPVDIPNGNRHSLRKNASALIFTEETSSAKKNIILIDTDSKHYEEHGIWRNTNHVNFYGNTPSREAVWNDLNKAVYHFTAIKSDSFQLAAWWTVNEMNTKQAAFILHHNEKTDTIHVDQTSYSSNGKWNVFGHYLINDGDYMEVINAGDGKLVTDAIRLVSIGPLTGQPKRGDLRIAVISDLNSGLGSATYEWQVDSIIQRIPRCWQPDLVLCGGDMVAGMGVDDTTTLSNMWKGFDDHIAEPLRTKKIPFAFTIGNHDGLRSYPLERDAIAQYWKTSDHNTGLNFVDNSHFPHYYSFRQGEGFFVSWDASSSEITKENLQWLANEFERPEAKNARFRFVVGHLPLYSVAQERDSKGNVLENGEALRKILERNNVDVYFSGHQHAYYPGKRGNLELLNAGAAGSGPRRWLSTDKEPVNTVTIADVFYEKDTIVYTTYDIKHREARDMTLFDYHVLPSSISGVNGFLIRNDIKAANKVRGLLHKTSGDVTGIAFGTVEGIIENNTLTISGNFMLTTAYNKNKDVVVSLNVGKNTEAGKVLFTIPYKTKNKNTGTFKSSFEISEDIAEILSVGGYHLLVRTEEYTNEELRAQLYPETNTAPEQPVIISHNDRNTYGIRDIKGLYKISWTGSSDKDGDIVSYTYQLASDSIFKDIILQEQTERLTYLKKEESSWYQLLKDTKPTEPKTLYHRVIASDGSHLTISQTKAIHLVKSDEPIVDLMEVDGENYIFDVKIANANGQGSGALWDKEGKLWLADYGGALYVKQATGNDAAFSPIHSVTINSKSYSLKPINGIGIDLDGNILVGSNRHLIKLNAKTGEGIAVWEAPEGERAITSPRVNSKGEIYAMSLFGDDPNYVLKESTRTPGTIELLRTIQLPQRILTRTFDMSSDGLHLFFPDPGSPIIQTFTSSDGITYKRSDDITSTAAGCNAIKIADGKIFAAVRASGISGSTLHMRNEKENIMWTLPLIALEGAESRGIAVSEDALTIIICAWDNGGGFYRYKKVTK